MTAQFDPTTFIAGPAIVTYDGATYYTKGNIALKINRESWDLRTAMHGKIDSRFKAISAEVSFQPDGQLENTAKLFPYAVADIGKSIFPAVDLPLVIWTLAGQKYTFGRAALIKMPSLKLAASDTAFGDLTFLCLVKSNTDPTTDDAFVKVEAAALNDVTFDETKVVTPGYTAAYGISFSAMESLNGFTVDITMDIQRLYVDRIGLVGARLTGLAATARFVPVGITEAQWHTLCLHDGSGALIPGQSLTKADTNLVIGGGTTPNALTVTLYKAGIDSDALNFGDDPRIGELVFVTRRTWAAGVGNPLWAISIA